MYEQGYSNNQSQATSPSTPQKVLRFDKSYVKTLPGLLKIVQLACNLIGFICIKVSWGAWISAIFYNLLYWIAILITSFILLAYTFHLVEKFDHWPWFKLEFFYCCLVSGTYLLLSIFATTIGENTGYAVAFFGLCAIITYGYDGYLKYREWKRGLPPQ